MRYALTFLALLLAAVITTADAQVTGGPGPGPSTGGEDPSIPGDTLFVFQPARPLIDSLRTADNYEDAFGIDVLFSNSGFGLGGFYQHALSKDLAAFVNVGFTGARTKDEFDRWIPSDNPSEPGRVGVPNKVNRVYALPMTVGVRYRLLDELIVDNFRPYINAGVGPTMIIALPYEYEFFSSIGHASAYFTGGGFVGVGAEFGSGRPLIGVNVRYYYIPFKPGVESLKGDPITQFGGLFLTANIGFLN